ncbi:MAG: OmpA family protein [Bacteroidota bacterium]
MMRKIGFGLMMIGFMWLGNSALMAQKVKPADFGIESKKALKLYQEGMELTMVRDRVGAINKFKEALALEPAFSHAHFQIGVNAYVKKRYEEALEHLEKVKQPYAASFRMLPFYLGVAYFFNSKYAEAEPQLAAFLENPIGRRQDLAVAERLLSHAKFAKEAIKEPVAFAPQNLGNNINTQWNDYFPWLTADDEYLIYTSYRPTSQNVNGRPARRLNEDFYAARKKGDSWEQGQNIGQPINTLENEGAASVTQDGKMIFFTACNRPGGRGDCDLYFSRREGKGWSEPTNLGPNVNSDSWDGQCCLSGDGKTLYFASNRPGGQGGRDIWFTEFTGNYWTPAQNLGDLINSAGNEDAPFLHADGKTLYFSSDLHPGFGAEDLFVSYLDENDSWSAPRNLGYPLNTVAVESQIFVSANGRQAFINSDREGGQGGSDIYEFEMDQRNRPQRATFLRGVTVDSLTRVPVYSRIRLIDVESGDTIRTIFSGRSDGKFLMSLPLNKEYAAFVEAKGYLFTSQNFYLKQIEEETYFDLTIPLLPIRKEVSVVLNNIFFESGSYELAPNSGVELRFLVDYMRRNPGLRIEIQGHTDDVGSDQDNLVLSQNRAESVRSYLIQQGVPANRIEAKGYGESQPVSGNITDEDRARNRRTEFKILDTGR